MDWEKYNLVPEEFKTAREIGLAAATLGAMARRGFVAVQDGSPKKYKKIKNIGAEIYHLCEIYSDQYDTYFTLYKEDAPYGMFCSISNGTIVDCWGKPYDLNNVIAISFRKKKFSLKEI
jgi:sugar-specific transcriptional regulator TrmB